MYSSDKKQTSILCQCSISPSIKMLTFVESVLHQAPFLHIAYSGRVDISQSQEQNHVPEKMVENCNVSSNQIHFYELTMKTLIRQCGFEVKSSLYLISLNIARTIIIDSYHAEPRNILFLNQSRPISVMAADQEPHCFILCL